MPATIKDIARRAGVSHSTVSRALQGSRLISSETTERIRQAATDLDYHPSAVARSLKTNSTRVLGVVVSSIDDPFFSEILQGIEDTAQAEGYSLYIAASQRDLAREQRILQAMMEHRTDGVIICSTSFGIDQRRELLTNGRPIVVVNNQAAEEYRYSIYHDDVDGSRQVTRHLIELGHRKIAYLGNSLSGRTTLDRQSGMQQEMASAGLQVPEGFIHEAAGSDPNAGQAAAGYFLSLSERPTAVFCYNDMLAIGLLKGLREAGLQVPLDISVAGFDNIIYSSYTHPPLTTFDQPKRYIGMEAARLLLGLLKTPDQVTSEGSRIRMLKGKLLVRESTGPHK
jgi:DNA-binding LacI/PurR family transcriptional regulator